MANSEVRERLGGKVEALLQALDARQMQNIPATPVIDALVDLIKALCPVVLPNLEPTSPHVSRLIRDIEGLLHAKVAAYSSAPTMERSAYYNASSTSLSFYPDTRTGNAPNISDDSSSDHTSIDETPDDMAEEDSGNQDGSLMLLDALEYDHNTAANTFSNSNDFDSLLALLAEDPVLYGGAQDQEPNDSLFISQNYGETQAQEPDDSLFVSQNYGGTHDQEPDDSLFVSQNNSQVIATSLTQGPEEWLMDNAEESISIPGSHLLASNTEGDDNGSVSSGPEGQQGTIFQALERLELAVEKEDISQARLNIIPSEFCFRMRWGVFNGNEANAIMVQLADASSTIQMNTTQYFTSRLAASQNPSEVSICDFASMGEIKRSPRRIIVVFPEPVTGAVVEVQPSRGEVVHYQLTTEPVEPSAAHLDCPRCLQVVKGLRNLQHNERTSGEWSTQLQNILISSHVDNMLSLLWVIHLRAEEKDPTDLTPMDFRTSLARDLFKDLKAACSKACVIQETTQQSTTAEQFWLSYGDKQGFGNRLWTRLQRLEQQPRDSSSQQSLNIGFHDANALLLLALNIASPKALVAVQESIRQARVHHNSTEREFPETVGGTFHAFMGHKEKRILSKIGSRLAIWRLYEMKKQYGRDELIKRIRLERPGPATWDTIDIETILRKEKKGVYWCHLVEHVANGNPNVLCLIPDSIEDIPPASGLKLNETSYRDMPIWQCKVVGQLCEELRPGIISSVDARLANTLLYLKQPPGAFPIENQNKWAILEQKLSSLDFFRDALRHQRTTPHSDPDHEAC